jgi:hypothetical protein
MLLLLLLLLPTLSKLLRRRVLKEISYVHEGKGRRSKVQ